MADIKYTMPPPTEDVEQMCLFRWADAQSGKYLELSLMYHIPNGGAGKPKRVVSAQWV